MSKVYVLDYQRVSLSLYLPFMKRSDHDLLTYFNNVKTLRILHFKVSVECYSLKLSTSFPLFNKQNIA